MTDFRYTFFLATALACGSGTSTPTPDGAPQGDPLIEVLQNAGVTSFAQVLASDHVDVGLDVTDRSARFTLFAPTDEAMAQFDADRDDIDLSDGVDQNEGEVLSAHLRYHVALHETGQGIASSEFVATRLLHSNAVNNASIIFDFGSVDPTKPLLRGAGQSALVVATDISAASGTVHTVDAVVSPGSVRDILSWMSDFSTVHAMLSPVTQIYPRLSDPNEKITVFAPVESVGISGTQDNQLKVVGQVITDGVDMTIAGDDRILQLSDFSQAVGVTLPTAWPNNSLTITREGTDYFLVDKHGGKAGLAKPLADIRATNGVVHGLDALLDPRP